MFIVFFFCRFFENHLRLFTQFTTLPMSKYFVHHILPPPHPPCITFVLFSFLRIISHHMPVRLKDSPKVQRTRLQYATWLGNTTSMLIVVDNDMYVKQSPSDEEDNRITNTGLPDLVYNGVPDWLYQGKQASKRTHQLIIFH